MKKVLFVVFLMALCSTMFAQQVQSGNFKLTTSSPGYTLDKNEGDRIMSIEVTYDVPFEVKPQVILSVTQLEADNGARVRYNVDASSISRDGFVIKVKTWGDTKLQQIGGSWIAVSGK